MISSAINFQIRSPFLNNVRQRVPQDCYRVRLSVCIRHSSRAFIIDHYIYFAFESSCYLSFFVFVNPEGQS